jgi:hypothetical protein
VSLFCNAVRIASICILICDNESFPPSPAPPAAVVVVAFPPCGVAPPVVPPSVPPSVVAPRRSYYGPYHRDSSFCFGSIFAVVYYII